MSPRRHTHPDRPPEKALLKIYSYVGGPGGVGRGVPAGPVSVGPTTVARHTDDDLPERFADSKQLTARTCTILIEPVHGWLVDHAAAHASPAGINECGIIGALRVTGLRVLQQVIDRGHAPGVIILDGVADWLTAPQPNLLTTLRSTHAPKDNPEPAEVPPTPPVRTEIRVDARCAVVAVASVLAKIEHDRLMANLDGPGYSRASNKGYASPAHIRGLTSLGVSDQHRRDWHLPSLDKHHH